MPSKLSVKNRCSNSILNLQNSSKMYVLSIILAPPTLECAALGISVGVSMKFVEEYEGEMTSSTLFVSAAVNEGSSSKCVGKQCNISGL